MSAGQRGCLGRIVHHVPSPADLASSPPTTPAHSQVATHLFIADKQQQFVLEYILIN